MKKLILCLAALMLATPSVAQNTTAPAPAINTSGLTSDQMSQIQSQADTMRAQSPEAQTSETLKNVQQYVEIGKGIGAGLGEAARSMGVAVNDFAATPVGRLTTWLIIWKVVGHDALGIIAGVAWFMVLFPMWVYYFRRLCLQGDINETFDKDTGKRLTRTTKALSLSDENAAGYRGVMLLVLVILVMIPTGVMVF